ncbi:MAG: hypothetical protein R3D25_13300 [Geminicoccaceae bacterium]
MRKFTRRAAGLAAAATIALIGGGASAQQALKFAHVYETSEAYHTAALWAAEQIAERTDGRYTMEVFPASSLGKETDINQGLTLGTVEHHLHRHELRRALVRAADHRLGALHVP